MRSGNEYDTNRYLAESVAPKFDPKKHRKALQTVRRYSGLSPGAFIVRLKRWLGLI